MTVGVLIVDDHPLFLQGLRVALDSEGDLVVVGEAGSGEEAVEAVARLGPAVQVVLMDLRLPRMPGVEAIRAITSKAAGHRPRVLVVSQYEDDDEVVAALRAGAHGYVAKEASRDELLRAVRTVAEGGAVFSASIAERLGTYFSAIHDFPGRLAFPQLTNREREILDLLARGHTNRRIARHLVLSDKTVRNHVSHIFAKLQVTNRDDAMTRARDAGLGA
ncbi:response regulator transcription factor [Streptomyces sp. ISL-12]|uniref:response regulator n=1 Tax=Streptomyces sp. ISL-12 TaxID=2819177 RepID=UPI001BE7F511|nr:response regulator transcription factor [Streptomyces sp. ISL-12]MBT2410596.1 response regulator transcription factor [Streptomyces sp. ISL-12]